MLHKTSSQTIKKLQLLRGKKVHCKRCITPKLVPPHDPFKEYLTTPTYYIQYEAKLSDVLYCTYNPRTH